MQDQLASSLYQMGSIANIKPLSTFLSCAVYKSQQPLWNTKNPTQSRMGARQEHYTLCYVAPTTPKSCSKTQAYNVSSACRGWQRQRFAQLTRRSSLPMTDDSFLMLRKYSIWQLASIKNKLGRVNLGAKNNLTGGQSKHKTCQLTVLARSEILQIGTRILALAALPGNRIALIERGQIKNSKNLKCDASFKLEVSTMQR